MFSKQHFFIYFYINQCVHCRLCIGNDNNGGIIEGHWIILHKLSNFSDNGARPCRQLLLPFPTPLSLLIYNHLLSGVIWRYRKPHLFSRLSWETSWQASEICWFITMTHLITRVDTRDTHTSYLTFLVRHFIFWPVNCTPQKCVNLRQKLHRDKTA